MELRGINPQGDSVSASIKSLAEVNKNEFETYQYGSNPHSVVYTNGMTNQKREVDLQEVAQASGIRNVQFHFDPEQAKSEGLIVPRDIDKGVAYNLERIKTDDLRQKYLAEKGYKNVVQDGDDFYSFENGKMYPINNKDGLDASDLVRLVAHAGRDIGSATAATAAIGGGAVAALPSGGSSVALGVAAAGAAGAVGGTIGEGAQRGFDKLIGADADKYNSQLTGGEEAAAAGKDAAIAGVGGALQPIGAAAVAGAKSLAAPALEKFGGEWGAMAAAKAQAGSALSRLPQGFMQKFASEEQMSAQAALTDTLDLAGQKAMTAEQVKGATGEAANMLKSGAQKPPMGEAEQAFYQQGLRQKYTSDTVQAAKQAQVDSIVESTQGDMDKSRLAELAAQQQENAKKFFGQAGYKKEMETVLSDMSDADASRAAQQKIVTGQASKFARNIGVKVETDPATGEVLGLDSTTFKNFVDNQRDGIFDLAKEHLDSQRAGAAFMETVPSDMVKGQTVSRIRSVVNDLDPALYKGELKEAGKDLINAVEGHAQGANGDVRNAVERFHSLAIDAAEGKNVNPKSRDAIDAINGAMQRYDVASTSARDAVQGYYAGFNKLMEVKSILGKNRGANTPEAFENMIRGLDQIAQSVGDHESRLIQPLVNATHLDMILTGEARTSQPLRNMLTPMAREHMDALQFIKEFDSGAGKERIATSSNQTKKVLGAVAGGIRAKMAGESVVGGMMEGYALSHLVPNTPMGAGKLLSKAGQKISGAAASLVQKGGSAALEGLDSIPGSTAAKAGFTGNLIAETVEEGAVNKMRRRGNE